MSVVKWVAGGWILFTVENVFLSENRTRLIEFLGQERYHALFNTLSSTALVSIAYGYLRFGPGRAVNPISRFFGGGFVVCGCALLSQLPLFQTSGNKKVNLSDDEVTGVYKVTRHPMLYGIGLVGLGLALRAKFTGRRALFAGPLGVALVGTHHQDSRFRRGMGGTLTETRDLDSPNIPFSAFIRGRHAWSKLIEEVDVENLIFGVAGSQFLMWSIWLVGKRRSSIQKKK